MELDIIEMYPYILNIYGDNGNYQILKKRCEWRGIKVNGYKFKKDEKLDISIEDADIILMGGASDKAQTILSEDLMKERDLLYNYIENNGVLLAICGSYQMFGNRYVDLNKENIRCLEIFDMESVSSENRLIGNIILENNIGLNPKSLVGFENHGGYTYHEYGNLGNVKYGSGNNGEDFKEGLVYKNFIGSYLHGPILSKNPHLADKIIFDALKRKYNINSLKSLDDSIELKAHNFIVDNLLNE